MPPDSFPIELLIAAASAVSGQRKLISHHPYAEPLAQAWERRMLFLHISQRQLFPVLLERRRSAGGACTRGVVLAARAKHSWYWVSVVTFTVHGMSFLRLKTCALCLRMKVSFRSAVICHISLLGREDKRSTSESKSIGNEFKRLLVHYFTPEITINTKAFRRRKETPRSQSMLQPNGMFLQQIHNAPQFLVEH